MALKQTIKSKMAAGNRVKVNFFGVEYEGNVETLGLDSIATDFHVTLILDNGDTAIIPLIGQTAVIVPKLDVDRNDARRKSEILRKQKKP